MRPNLIPVLFLALAAALFAGCGDSDDSGSSSKDASTSGATQSDDDSAAQEKQHLDGTIKVEGTQLVLTPEGRAPITLELGDDVERAEVQALASSGAPARVEFTPATGEGNGTVVSVHAQTPHEGAQKFEGTVTKVDESSITLKGDAGEKTFPLSPSVAEEVDHLNEHASEGEPIRVFLEKDGGTLTVIAFEDA
jgi:hypothetical protein